MSSSPKPTIINSESIQPRRKWLKSKLDNLQQSYNDVLLRFKQRLDAIVTPIINETDNILSATDEVLFFKKHFEIGINIEKSCHDLFEINLLCCNEEKTLYDTTSTSTLNPKDPVVSSTYNDGMLQSMCTQTESSSYLPVFVDGKCQTENIKTYEKSCQTDCSSKTFSSQICQTDVVFFNCVETTDEYTYYTDSDSSRNDYSWRKNQGDFDHVTAISKNNSHSKVFNSEQSNQLLTPNPISNFVEPSITEGSVHDEAELKEDTIMTPLHLIINEEPDNSLDEIDLLLLHDVTRGQNTSVLVTHVESPCHFTIQPKSCIDQLVEMQHQINDYYTSPKGESLNFCDLPSVGTICIARFDVDGCWYRAKITKQLPSENIQILFIDYGNYSVNKLKDLRCFYDSILSEVPPFAITCSLFDSEALAVASEWLPATVNWFRDQICDCECQAIFPIKTKQIHSIYFLQLFGNVTTTSFSDNKQNKIKIAQCKELLKCFEQQLGSKKDKKLVDMAHAVLQYQKSRFENNFNQESSDFDACLDIILNDEGVEEDQILQTEQVETEVDFYNWDPMKADHESQRNKYNINVDNACVAIENVDPSQAEVCKYFAKGDCWKGKHCDRSHILSLDVLRQTRVFATHEIDCIEMEAEEVVVIKVLTQPDNEDFYVHVIRRNTNLEEEKESFNYLKRLTEDMKSFYTTRSTRQSISWEVGMGEVYILHHQKVYCRVSIIDTSTSQVTVYFLDYGTVEKVPIKRLLPMEEAFMHLQAQAVLCTYDRCSSQLAPEKNCSYFAKVGETMAVVDSPTPLLLLKKF